MLLKPSWLGAQFANEGSYSTIARLGAQIKDDSAFHVDGLSEYLILSEQRPTLAVFHPKGLCQNIQGNTREKTQFQSNPLFMQNVSNLRCYRINVPISHRKLLKNQVPCFTPHESPGSNIELGIAQTLDIDDTRCCKL